mmetsp:Transcript_1974/g.5876  ORF Transcript_1974/g.5876 Transcript_1974/m.5876 type:complete len:232 (+) Transcript_1974:923-1618(+)
MQGAHRFLQVLRRSRGQGALRLGHPPQVPPRSQDRCGRALLRRGARRPRRHCAQGEARGAPRPIVQLRPAACGQPKVCVLVQRDDHRRQAVPHYAPQGPGATDAAGGLRLPPRVHRSLLRQIQRRLQGLRRHWRGPRVLQPVAPERELAGPPHVLGRGLRGPVHDLQALHGGRRRRPRRRVTRSSALGPSWCSDAKRYFDFVCPSFSPFLLPLLHSCVTGLCGYDCTCLCR